MILGTHADLITEATRQLAGVSESPRLDAEVLLRAVAGLDRTGLLVVLRDPIAGDTGDRFRELVAKRATGIPVAYLTGTREFMGLSFQVNEHVLVPRPETELLVEWALRLLEKMDPQPVRAVDVGSGSGAIAVTLATLAPDAIEVLAIEPSPGARDVIARNREALIPEDRRTTLHIVDDDLLVNAAGPFDLVLANLPYLTPSQIAENPALDTEPRMALDGGDDGLELIARLIGQLPDRVNTRYAVGLEIDPSQARRVVEMLEQALPESKVSVIRDYAGHARHAVATDIFD